MKESKSVSIRVGLDELAAIYLWTNKNRKHITSDGIVLHRAITAFCDALKADNIVKKSEIAELRAKIVKARLVLPELTDAQVAANIFASETHMPKNNALIDDVLSDILNDEKEDL